jgi:hypothetical protein
MTDAEKLDKIREIYETKTPIEGFPRGKTSTHIRHNLDGAMIDLERQGADKICLGTLQRIKGQLLEIEKVLGL